MRKSIQLILVILVTLLLAAGCAESGVKQVVFLTGTDELTYVVRPDAATQEASDAAVRLRKIISEQCGESCVGSTTDYVGKKETFPEETKEILVGLTNRKESEQAYSLLPQRANNGKDFAIAYIGNKLAIVGGSDEALDDAVTYFAENYIVDGTVTVPEDLSYVYIFEYPKVMVGGVELCDFSIVYPYDDNYLYRTAAENLSAIIEESVGYSLPVINSLQKDTVEHSIRVGLTESDTEEYTVTVSDGNIEITGSPAAVEYACSDYSKLSSLFTDSVNIDETFSLTENRIEVLESLSAVQEPINADTSSFEDYGHRAYAYHIIDDDSTNRGGLTSSWDYDSRGAGDSQDYVLLTSNVNDISTVEPSYITRQLTPQSEGIIKFETMYGCSGDGTVIELCNTLGEYALKLEFADRTMYILTPDGNMESIAEMESAASQLLEATVDFYNDQVTLVYDNVDIGTFPFADDVAYVDMLRFGVIPEKTGNFSSTGVKMYANYLVNERFIGYEGVLPSDITFEVPEDAELCTIRPNGGMFGGNFDNKSLEVISDSFGMKKDFEKTSGKVVYELKFMLPERADNLSFSLNSGENSSVTVNTLNFGLFTGDGVLLRDYYSENVWHTLRIEADTSTQKALIKLNGKELGEVWFENESKYFDSISVNYAGNENAHFYIDEIYVFADPQFDNYVPEPVISQDDDYTVGINICSLWREGTHFGWDKISAYDEIKPLLGFYDEGVPEVMDWEIKWMTEHGIDFQLFCWYASSPDTPMMHTHLFDALMNGYMNAKYSDRMKFAILWECANAARPESSEDFRTIFVPYWVEHFLSDDRYMTIDGKALIAVFGAEKLIDSLGGAEACAKEFDYLDEICKELGYEGAMYIVCSGTSNAGSLKNLKNAGFDAVYAYNWGKTGYDPDYTKDAILAQVEQDIIHVVPTLSTGFNNVGWAGTRSPNMNLTDFASMLRYFRDDLLESYNQDNWESEFIMLSTWNEFGEGTYITPSGLNGFGYVDEIRKQFGNTTVEHSDVTPDSEAMKRFTQMYSPYRNTLEPLYTYTPEFKGELYDGWYFDDPEDRAKWGVHFGIDSYAETDTSLTGSSTASDYAIKCFDMSDMDINLDDMACIKVVMKSSSRATAQFFFLTDTDDEWNGTKSISAIVGTDDDWKEYTFSAKNTAGWTGKLTDLRFDPMDTAGSFEIKSIEFYEKEQERLYVNGTPIENEYGYDMADGDVFFSVNPQTGILARLGLAYRWNKAEKQLTLYNASASVRFTIGSDTAEIGVADVNGFETPEPAGTITLSHPVGEVDGLPILSAATIAEIFGYEASFDETGTYINITTPLVTSSEDD